MGEEIPCERELTNSVNLCAVDGQSDSQKDIYLEYAHGVTGSRQAKFRFRARTEVGCKAKVLSKKFKTMAEGKEMFTTPLNMAVMLLKGARIIFCWTLLEECQCLSTHIIHLLAVIY